MQSAAEHYKSAGIDLYIETASGQKFFFDRPVFNLADMAHAISMQCRFTGHCHKFYSVAEHSLLVSRIMDEYQLGDPFEGLMHDGTEAYLSDIAAPWKAMLPDYKRIEAELEVKMRGHFDLPPKITDGCKKADWLALFVEARQLITTGARDWIAPPGIKELAAKIDISLVGFGPEEGRRRFLNRFAHLRPSL